MHFLKRFEIWLLLAAIIGGLAWVFMAGDGGEEDTPGGQGSAGDAQAPLVLHRCILNRDHSFARLDIELKVRNDSAEKLVMTTPKVELLTGKGRSISGYYLALNPPPEVPAKSTKDVQLRYWLEAADLQGTLTLKVDGKTLEVKGGNPFDLNSAEDGGAKVIGAGAW